MKRSPEPENAHPVKRARGHSNSNKAASTGNNYNQFRCPVKLARPGAQGLPSTCSTDKKCIRLLKEHIKNDHHKCDCDERSCQNPCHLTADELLEIKKTNLRHHQSPGEQWTKIMRIIAPEIQPPPPYRPTADQLTQLSLYPPPELLDRLQKQFDEDYREGIVQTQITTKDFFIWYRSYYNEVCQTGAVPVESDGNTSADVTPHVSVSRYDSRMLGPEPAGDAAAFPNPPCDPKPAPRVPISPDTCSMVEPVDWDPLFNPDETIFEEQLQQV